MYKCIYKNVFATGGCFLFSATPWIFPRTFNLITYYFFSFWSEGLRCAILTLKMPSEFLGKKNCPYLPSRPQLITNCIFFFFMQYVQMYIQKCIIHSHVNKRICILQLITFFSRYLAGFSYVIFFPCQVERKSELLRINFYAFPCIFGC